MRQSAPLYQSTVKYSARVVHARAASYVLHGLALKCRPCASPTVKVRCAYQRACTRMCVWLLKVGYIQSENWEPKLMSARESTHKRRVALCAGAHMRALERVKECRWHCYCQAVILGEDFSFGLFIQCWFFLFFFFFPVNFDGKKLRLTREIYIFQ